MRLVPAAALRVADVALFYGRRSGGIRTYLDAKARFARESGEIEHHLLVPGPRERHHAGRHELRSLPVSAANGYRAPVGDGALIATLRDLRPDIVLLHDPFWLSPRAIRGVQRDGALVVAVHHASSELSARGLPGPGTLYRPALRARLRRAYAEVDAVMSAIDTFADARRAATVPLRFGLDPAFRPRPELERGDHVLYVGRLAKEKGVFELLEAARAARDPWPLRFVGSGPAEEALRARAQRLGIEQRVSFSPYVSDRARLAELYARARCVVMPGVLETFGLVAFEAAACGAAVVTCETAPCNRILSEVVTTFRPGDLAGLREAVERARRSEPDPLLAAVISSCFTWERAFTAELEDLRELLG